MKIATILTLVLVGFGTASTIFTTSETCLVSQTANANQKFVAGFKESIGGCKIASKAW